MSFTFGSLFSGIGGIDLGLTRAGMSCSWQVEIDEYAQKVLQKHWPNVARHGDIRECGRDTLARVDLIAGGFPCQDISSAGKRAGITGERSGLWSEFYRIICELRPRYVLVENVAALLYPIKRDGYTEPAPISRVLGDLAEGRYDAEWQILPAAAFGAPHIRERVFIVAYTTSSRQQECPNTRGLYHQSHSSSPLADSDRQRCQECNATTITAGTRRYGRNVSTFRPYREPQSRMGRMFNGLPARLDRYYWPARPGEQQHDWEPARVTTERLPNRGARLKALGNAVVPQIAEYIGRLILEREQIA